MLGWIYEYFGHLKKSSEWAEQKSIWAKPGIIYHCFGTNAFNDYYFQIT